GWGRRSQIHQRGAAVIAKWFSLDLDLTFELTLSRRASRELVVIDCLEQLTGNSYHSRNDNFDPRGKPFERETTVPILPFQPPRSNSHGATGQRSANSRSGILFCAGHRVGAYSSRARRRRVEGPQRSELEAGLSQPAPERNVDRVERCDHSGHGHSGCQRSIGEPLP